ncbi:hypothetical protein ACFQZ4_33700 [Catellatospora coxensis]
MTRRRPRVGAALAAVGGLAGVGLAAWWATGGTPGTGAGLAEDGHDHGLLLGRLTAEFTGLVGRQELTPGFAALAMLVALALGAGHALAPGHGKLLMATYLVNERGRCARRCRWRGRSRSPIPPGSWSWGWCWPPGCTSSRTGCTRCSPC